MLHCRKVEKEENAMNRRYSMGGGGKPSCSKGFSDFNCRNFINYCHAFVKKQIAFTLAETLIVMGIIGVVAALTLPNLNSSTGEKEKVAKVKKIYQNLQDAYGRATAVYGPFDEWFKNDATQKAATKRTAERFTEFMKVSKNCGMETGKGCFADTYYFLDSDSGDQSADIDDSFYKVVLADGTSLGFLGNNSGSYLLIEVDIDGPNKGSSMYNRDIFAFTIDSDNELVPDGYQQTGNLNKASFCVGNEGCTAWVIKNDNMDYLKADSSGKCNGVQLNWDTQTTCK